MTLPLLAKLAGARHLLRRQLGLSAHFDATGDHRRATRFYLFLNQGAFQFRQYPTIWRGPWGRGVNGFRQRAAQSVELPDNKGAPCRECLKTAGQFRPLDMRLYDFSIMIRSHPTFFNAASCQSGF